MFLSFLSLCCPNILFLLSLFFLLLISLCLLLVGSGCLTLVMLDYPAGDFFVLYFSLLLLLNFLLYHFTLVVKSSLNHSIYLFVIFMCLSVVSFALTFLICPSFVFPHYQCLASEFTELLWDLNRRLSDSGCVCCVFRGRKIARTRPERRSSVCSPSMTSTWP